MKAEHLHAKLMLEAERHADQQWEQDRLTIIALNMEQPVTKVESCRRQLQDLRVKACNIEYELQLRKKVALESERLVKATLALRGANMTLAERETREREIRRGQILYSNQVLEAHPDWREQEGDNAELYRQQTKRNS
jgi:hypothetical protein